MSVQESGGNNREYEGTDDILSTGTMGSGVSAEAGDVELGSLALLNRCGQSGGEECGDGYEVLHLDGRCSCGYLILKDVF